jgi:hypothetical protein
MRDIATFQELVDAAASHALPRGQIYRTAGRSSPFECTFVLTTSREDVDVEQIEVDGEEMPLIVHERGMAHWIDTPTFEGVVRSRREKTGKVDVEDIAVAVDYYLENDDFMD